MTRSADEARYRARDRIRAALLAGPRTATELGIWALRYSPYSRAALRDELLAELVAEGLVTRSLEPAGHFLRPTPTYRLATVVAEEGANHA